MNRFTAFTTIVAITLLATACGGELGTPINSVDRSANNTSNNSSNNSSSANSTSSSTANNSCLPTTEVCDGEDNDCDGEVDEDFAVGSTCSVGVGECAVEGVMVCSEAGDAVVCGADAGEAVDELCGDNLDNDCDGEVDEGFDDLGDECTREIGVCTQTGVMICSEDGTSTMCLLEELNPPEVDEISCDGDDNDCDGEVDEGCDDDGDEWCADGFLSLAGGPCTAGAGDCDDTNADIFPGSTIPGCDGADNDCDGDSDEVELVPGSDVTASMPINVDSTDRSGAPGLLVAPMQGDRFCGAASSANNSTILLFFVDTSGPAVELAGSIGAGNLRLLDLVADADTCTALISYGDFGGHLLALVSTSVGSVDVQHFANVTGDEVYVSAVWAGAMYASAGGEYRILGFPTNRGNEAVLYGRSLGFLVSIFEGATTPMHHAALAPDTSGSNNGDLIMGNTSGETRHWITDLPNFNLIIPWAVSFPMFYPDVEQVDSTTFQSGYDGTTFRVRTLLYDTTQSVYAVEATGTQPTTTDRDYMTRHQFFEGAGGAAYAADAAADEVYRLTVNGGTISFDRVETGLLATGSQVVAGKSLGADTMQILALKRPASNDVEFTAWTAGCF